jgi:dihydrofolate synthase/folylpolyglutamate synthase
MIMAAADKRSKTSQKATKKKLSSSVEKVKRQEKAFRTYEQALEYLFSRTDYEKQQKLRYNVTTFDLERMNTLLRNMGNPHKKTKSVHIAGTKGKGSTATMLARMMEANGYKVGLYTSPHVSTLHERIAINSEMISRKELLGLMNRVQPVLEKMAKKNLCPTFFEIMTAMAFLYRRHRNRSGRTLRQHECDYPQSGRYHQYKYRPSESAGADH